MGTVFISHNVFLLSLRYDNVTEKISYEFKSNGNVEIFSAKSVNNKGIKGLEYSDELDNFIMLIMPFEPNISKKLVKLTWDYIEGREVAFPIQLVP
ncbi:hypothetical protein MUZ84_004914 [Salmonella enterica]|nr:hypothetical protein [Salmonella enterica subsp. enterica]EGT9726110.1 hypothetical protein [Salmonella enterica]EHW1158043.1 hypothetical protein [Salmonella enterica subsp. enterica serovar Takoradi]EDU0380515.1 hypothetical protein [Salmonella enterica subsp. enterica]EJA8226280.1 hypothetical protein [Salmonella enterica]